jgi:transposase
MKPLSNDLRERIIAAVDHREGSRRLIARRFVVDVSCLTRLLRLRRRTGSIEPKPHGGGKAPVLDQGALERLRHLVEAHPDATLRRLREELGVGGSIMIIWRALKELGITRKKKTKHADERDRPDVQRKREPFRKEVKPIGPGRLAFVTRPGSPRR